MFSSILSKVSFLALALVCMVSAASAQGPDPASIDPGTAAFAAMHDLRPDSLAELRGKDVSSDMDGVAVSGYLSEPANPLPGKPAVIVIHEWWGLNKHIRETADALAAKGYTALAVDLYEGKVATTPEESRAAMKAVDADKALGSLRAAVAWLRQGNPARPVGSLGWCFGGGWSARLAMNEPLLNACVIYYGTVSSEPAEVGGITCPVLGIFAEKDASITPRMATEFKEAAESVGVSVELHIFDADHAFANPSGSRFDAEDAAKAWELTYDFLSKNLVAK